MNHVSECACAPASGWLQRVHHNKYIIVYWCLVVIHLLLALTPFPRAAQSNRPAILHNCCGPGYMSSARRGATSAFPSTGGLWHSQCCELEAVVDLFNGDLGSLGWPEWRDGRATLSAVQARPETGRYGWQEPIHSAVGTWGSSGSGVGGGSGRSAHFERSYQLPSGDGTWLLTT